MKHHTTILTSRQHELEARLDPAWQPETEAPVVGTGNLVYEMGEKVRAIAAGGIGLVEQLVEAIGLRARLDERVQVFTRHRPYHESDHILTMAYNVLTGGQALEDIDRLRNDVTFLGLSGFPNAETLNLTMSYVDVGLIGHRVQTRKGPV